ncbi:MAG: glycosyltransferase [Candidatus Pacebacteria bacterium]|nr:glycosyltransferase [Candidatus Paceibacterota bacterium]
MFSIHSDPLAHLGSQETGGQNIYVRSLAEELGKLGHKVDVFTRWDSTNKKHISQINKNARVVRLRGGKKSYVQKTELFNILPEVYLNFLKFIEVKDNYDVFHGHYWDGAWMALKAKCQFSKPLIENFHSLGKIRQATKKKYLTNKNETDYFQKRFDVEKETVERADAVVSLAKSEKESLVKIYDSIPGKVKVIPGGVNLQKFKPLSKEKARESLRIDQKNFVLLYVGRLEWRKGIGSLITATKLLKKKIPNIKIVIVGGKIHGKEKNVLDFKEYERLLEKAKKEKVENLIKFTGMINHRRLRNFYSAADALIVPSYYEPFGLVALEGMATKIPVIVSAVGGLKEIISHKKTGLLFKARSPVDIKNKVQMLYSSKRLQEKLIKNGYKYVSKNHSWPFIAKKISDEYKKYI